MLPQVDYLSLHCPLTPDNEQIVDTSALALMKPTAFLINTARGGLVNSLDLITALKKGVIRGAGIDVLNTEPPSTDEILLAEDLPNLVVTPHNAWAARESRERLLLQMVENIRECQNNHFPRSVLAGY
jgi:glycerate dehydrogenase